MFRPDRMKFGIFLAPFHRHYENPTLSLERDMRLMVLLDHLTRGRVMLGVGPGALYSDAQMLGIPTTSLRERMEESLDVIMRLLTETEPITHKSSWFELADATLHLRPYTRPHFPIAVAS